mgnify:CR=1 FL=1
MSKKSSLLVIVIFLAGLLTACSVSGESNITPTPDLYVFDKEGLIAALNAADAVREIGDPVLQEYFSVGGASVKVRESDILVFEFFNQILEFFSRLDVIHGKGSPILQ